MLKIDHIKNMTVMAVIAMAVIVFSSCGKAQNIPDTMSYIPGQDMQYFQYTEYNKNAYVQETETGCYFYRDHFIYYLNREEKQIYPLCSKPNCLHDKETDPEMKKNCSAYLARMKYSSGNGNSSPVSLMLYEDYLYIAYETIWNTVNDVFSQPSCICRIKLDGSEQDVFFETSKILLSIVHRGYIYFQRARSSVDDESIHTEYLLSRIKTGELFPKEELISSLEAKHTMPSLLRAFGNYVYFDTSGLDDEGNPGSTGVYNIHTGELEITDKIGIRPIWFNGRLYWKTNTREGSVESLLKAPVPIVSSDYKGDDLRVEMEGVYNSSTLYCDGKYLYVSNNSIRYFLPDEINCLKIYDKELKLIDEAVVPEINDINENPLLAVIDSPIGGSGYQYLPYEDEESGEWGVLVWDKSEIGTLHGSFYTQQKIVY